MGACCYKKKQPNQVIPYHFSICPHCNMNFDNFTIEQIDLHISICQQNPVLARAILEQRSKLQYSENQEYWEKVKIDEKGKFKWEKKTGDYEAVEQIVRSMTLEEIKQEIFLYKQIWFRTQIEKVKIPWESGCEIIQIDLKEIIESSLKQMESINLRKELKIIFKGEEVQDAGGLLREYIVLIIGKLFDKNTQIFERTETEEQYYRLNRKLKNLENNKKYLDLLRLFGGVLAKGILEKIPIQVNLDHTFLSILCGRNPTLEDVNNFDQAVINDMVIIFIEQLYQQLKYIEKTDLNEVSNLGVTFVIQEKMSEVKNKENDQQVEDVQYIEIPLKENGEQIFLDNNNKDEYQQLMIYQKSQKDLEQYFDVIKQEVYQIIPQSLLSIFSAEELEIIISGLPFIDIQDWMEHTEYRGEYHKKHQIIQWFWMVVKEFTHQELQQLLQFTTGCTRTPVEGFSKLESNRNTLTLFCIESVPYDDNNQYPKAHTCFNRLELPLYKDQETLKKNLNAVLNVDLQELYGKD